MKFYLKVEGLNDQRLAQSNSKEIFSFWGKIPTILVK